MGVTYIIDKLPFKVRKYVLLLNNLVIGWFNYLIVRHGYVISQSGCTGSWLRVCVCPCPTLMAQYSLVASFSFVYLIYASIGAPQSARRTG